uniref:Prolyl endopeptidase n=1 Tax=Ditylenchus dipsaci TaxID=166011 RepID=A0A915EK92_9BILA
MKSPRSSTVGWTGFRRMRACSTRLKYPDHKGALEGSSTEKHKFHSLYYHKLGTDCKEDVLVADFRENENFLCDGSVTEDGKYLIVEVSDGCGSTNQIYFYDLRRQQKIDGKLSLSPLCTKFDAKYDVGHLDLCYEGESALLLTNHNSPMFKLIWVKINSDAENPSTWETVIEEDPKRKLEWVAPVARNKMVVSYLEDVKTTLYVHDLEPASCFIRSASNGSVTGFYGRKNKTQNPVDPDDANDFEFIYKYSPQHPFDQRCAVAVHVLAVRGAYETGLVVAACSQQRPELFGAVMIREALLDMLRFHNSIVGKELIEEHVSDDANDFEFIYKYSPLHNIRLTKVCSGVPLLMTGGHDIVCLLFIL